MFSGYCCMVRVCHNIGIPFMKTLPDNGETLYLRQYWGMDYIKFLEDRL